MARAFEKYRRVIHAKQYADFGAFGSFFATEYDGTITSAFQLQIPTNMLGSSVGFAASGVSELHVGSPLTAPRLGQNRDLERLRSIISQFATAGLSWCPDRTATISSETAKAAAQFVRLLGFAKRLPQVAPDGEGSLLAYWDQPEPLLITIENWTLHAVSSAGTDHAVYLAPQVLSVTGIPAAINALVPNV